MAYGLQVLDLLCGEAEGTELRTEGFDNGRAQESNFRNEVLQTDLNSESFCVALEGVDYERFFYFNDCFIDKSSVSLFADLPPWRRALWLIIVAASVLRNTIIKLKW
jgi:hypothetical protein